MEKKSFQEKLKKFNIIDIIAVVLIALAALAVLWKVVDRILPDEPAGSNSGAVSSTGSQSAVSSEDPAGSGAVSGDPVGSSDPAGSGVSSKDPSGSEDLPADPGPVYVTYVVRAENVAAELYENAKRYIPSQLMAAGKLYDAWVTAVEKEPVMVLAANGMWVEDPDHVTLLFTVEGEVDRAEVMTTLVATQEVRIGDPGYDLKTEYLEFRDTTVVDVKWENWDFGASRGAEEQISGENNK